MVAAVSGGLWGGSTTGGPVVPRDMDMGMVLDASRDELEKLRVCVRACVRACVRERGVERVACQGVGMRRR